LLAAARKLEGENIRFDVVGPIGISQEAIASAPRNMTFHGRATRDQAANWYRQADLFVCRRFPMALPSRNWKPWRMDCRL